MPKTEFLERGVIAEGLLSVGALSHYLAGKLAYDLGDLLCSCESLPGLLADLTRRLRSSHAREDATIIQLGTAIAELEHIVYHGRRAIQTLEAAWKNMNRRGPRLAKKAVRPAKARQAKPKRQKSSGREATKQRRVAKREPRVAD